MFRIERKMHIIGTDTVPTKKFHTSPVTQVVSAEFICSQCNSTNLFEIAPYVTGFPFDDLYQDGKILSGEEIIEKEIARVTSPKAANRGEYTVFDLLTLYFGVNCTNCHSNHLIVFGMEEVQQGSELCIISGSWRFEWTP